MRPLRSAWTKQKRLTVPATPASWRQLWYANCTNTACPQKAFKKRTLSTLLNRVDRCQDFFIGRFLASASEHRPSLGKVHQLFGILSDAAEMVRSRHFSKQNSAKLSNDSPDHRQKTKDLVRERTKLKRKELTAVPST